jgi:plastocyanin
LNNPLKLSLSNHLLISFVSNPFIFFQSNKLCLILSPLYKMQFSTFTLLSAVTAIASAAQHSVEVGNGGFTFTPNNLTAAAGDTVVFTFYPSKHSVAQASFAKPCVPLNSSSFFSGAMSTTSGVNSMTYTLTINDTQPIWFYCSVASHCEAGMVGSINAA